MKVLEKYDGTKTYMFPNGSLATPDVMKQQFPAVLAFAHIIETDESGEVCFAVQNLAAMRSLHSIDKALAEGDAIAALQKVINTPPEIIPDQQTIALAAIAAQLEYQNLMTLEDAIV